MRTACSAWHTVDVSAARKPTRANSASVIDVIATPTITGTTDAARDAESRSLSIMREKRMVKTGPSVFTVCTNLTLTLIRLHRYVTSEPTITAATGSTVTARARADESDESSQILPRAHVLAIDARYATTPPAAATSCCSTASVIGNGNDRRISFVVIDVTADVPYHTSSRPTRRAVRGRQSDVTRCTMCGAAAQSSASWATAATASRKVYSGVVIAGGDDGEEHVRHPGALRQRGADHAAAAPSRARQLFPVARHAPPRGPPHSERTLQRASLEIAHLPARARAGPRRLIAEKTAHARAVSAHATPRLAHARAKTPRTDAPPAPRRADSTMAEINKGSYCYKITGKKGALKATAFGEVAEGMPECTAATMAELEAAMYAAVKEKSGKETFTYSCDCVTPKAALFMADIDTVKAM